MEACVFMVINKISKPANFLKSPLLTAGLVACCLSLQNFGICEASSYLTVDESAEEHNISDYHINTEENRLLELIEEDLNFVNDHPTCIMSAAQIIYAMILDQGHSYRDLPGYGNVPVYSIFSEENEVNGRRRIVGQYEGIKAVVEGIEAQARGLKTGVRVPLLVGIHGTGKTEFRTVVANVLRNLTRNDSKFYVHEISWLVPALKDIPEIANYIKVIQGTEFRSPLHSSPVSILPKAYQDVLKKRGKQIIQDMLGSYPVFDMEADPLSKYIRNAIMKYFLTSSDDYVESTLTELGIERNEGGSFSALDEVKILDKYMRIRRVVLGEPGTVPLIDAQGDEIDYQGLIMSENPIFRMLTGASDVWSWSYNGAVLSGSRNFIFLDEFFRNDPALRDMFLGIMESRVVTRGGSPAVPVDSVIIAATNSANLDKALVDSKSHAQVNRMRQIPFEWSTNPGEIAMILLYMNGKGIQMKKLDVGTMQDDMDQDFDLEFQPMLIDELFPKIVSGKPMLTPDARYKLVFGNDEEDGVFIAPHTLMFMADFIATTRINTSVKDAQELKGGEQIIGDPIFRDPLTRLKVLKNEAPILGSQQQELYKLSKKLREGSFGMSSRVAGTWLSESINEARQAGNDQTLTPIILRRVYERLLNEGTLEILDIPTEIKWKSLMDTVAEGVLIPKLHNDIYSSFHSDGKASEIYDEIILEIVTLFQDVEAKEYETPNGQQMNIDRDRLEKVSKIFQQKTGRPLAVQQMATFYLQQIARSNGAKARRNKNLLDSISEYLATSLDAYISVKDLLNYAEKKEGNKSISEKFRSVESVLIHKLGYNKRSIIDALRIMKQYKEKLEH